MHNYREIYRAEELPVLSEQDVFFRRGSTALRQGRRGPGSGSGNGPDFQ